MSFAKLVVDVAKEIGADFIIKGLRSTIDFESEISQAQVNLNVSGVHTLFLPSASANSAVASKYIRDIAASGAMSNGPAAGGQALSRRQRLMRAEASRRPVRPQGARRRWAWAQPRGTDGD